MKIKNFLLILIIIFSLNAYAENSVDEIINKANLASYYQGDDGKSAVKMVITDEQGRTREREFIILRKDQEDGKKQLFYVFFKSPADVRNTVFMVWKNPAGDDDRWMYLPALDLVKRIAASDKRSSFVGSDFLYEDVSGRGVDEDTHILDSEDDKFYIIKNIPKNPESVEFKSFKVWIDKKNFLPVKAEYYNSADKLYRIVESLEVKEINGFPTTVKSKVTNIEAKSSTLLTFSNVEYNINLNEKIFTERYLKRPPREVR